MKKVIYAILICIIVAGAIIIGTLGLKADIIYSKNAQIDVYIGKEVNVKDIQAITKEVFPNDRVIIQKVELFNDMVSIIIPEKSDEELSEKVEQLNTKINEKYGIENKTEDLTITHNPKIKLSSIIKPYILPMAIGTVLVLIFVAIRYHKLGSWKTLASYILAIAAVEAVFLSVIAIARFPIKRLIIPIGLLLDIITITVLGFRNESELGEKLKELETN